MNIETMPLKDRKQTAKQMYKLIGDYSRDLHNIFIDRHNSMVSMSNLSLPDYFNVVKTIPYRQDTEPLEVIGRPYLLFQNKDNGLDCKKKSILIGSYLKENRLEFRLIGSSNRKDGEIHHVFPQVRMNGNWYNVDATYPDFKLYEQKNVTAWEVL